MTKNIIPKCAERSYLIKQTINNDGIKGKMKIKEKGDNKVEDMKSK